jgi:hypothetical protein
MRKLLSGAKIREQKEEFAWTLGSKCPLKYLHIDCETADLWVRHPKKGWVRPDNDLLKSAKKAIAIWEKWQKEWQKRMKKP